MRSKWPKQRAMTLQLLDRSIDQVIGDRFRSRNQTPQVVYHYISWEGLSGILSDKMMRLTDVESLDDDLEYAHAQDLISGVASDLLATIGSQAARVLRNFIGQFPALSVRQLQEWEPFVGCFCLREEDAHLWSKFGRGGAGYCLGIQILDERPHEADDAPFTLHVSYDQAAEREWIAQGFCQLLALAERGARLSDDRLLMITKGLFRLAAFSSFAFKSAGYAREKEWRLLMWPKRGQASFNIVKAPGRRFLEYPLRSDKRPVVLCSVHVGVRNGPDGVARVKDLLSQLGYGGQGMPPMPEVILSTVEPWLGAADATRRPVPLKSEADE